MRKDLLRKLSDASLVKRYERGESEWDETKGADFILNPLEAMELTSNQSSTTSAAITISSDGTNGGPVETNARSHFNYPSWNYLSLRHEQNSAWAQLQFEKGIEYAKEALNPSCKQNLSHDLASKAEVYYKEGLAMVPHHTRLLTAYGALCINNGRWEMAHDLLTKGIRLLQDKSSTEDSSDDTIIDNDTLKDAKTYLTVVESKLHVKAQVQAHAQAQAKKGQVHLSNKAEQAMNDAFAERAFAMGDDAPMMSSKSFKTSVVGTRKRGAYGQLDEYQLLSSSSSSSSSSESETESRRRRRRRKERHSRDKRRKCDDEGKKRSSRRKRDRDHDSSRSRKKRGDRFGTLNEDDGNNNYNDDKSVPSESCDSESYDRGRRKLRKERHKKKRKSASRRETSRSKSKSRGRSRSNSKSRASFST